MTHGLRTCGRCRQKKPSETVVRICIECRRETRLRRENRRWAPEFKRVYTRLNFYGMTVAQYKELRKVQDDKCCICREALPTKDHIDHCHKTGVVRGILCNRCNTGLGNFFDDPDVLRRAVEYLEHARTPHVVRRVPKQAA